MSTINGKACVVDGKPVDKVFSNGRQVYGRNLLSNSGGKFQPNRSSVDNNATYENSKIYMTKGQQYTVHADASSGLVWGSVHASWAVNRSVTLWLIPSYVIISDANTGIGTTFTWNNSSGNYYIRVNTYNPDNSGYVENVKIEKDSVATPWTPAPEDVM